jgi:Flp pilus assembly protein TadG
MSLMKRIALPMRQKSRETGSALVMIPVIVLIIVMAASIVVDSTVGFTAKRSLVEAASAAANDAANGLQNDPLYDDGGVRLNDGLVWQLAQNSLSKRADGIDNVTLVSATVRTNNGEQSVVVVVSGIAKPVFGFFGADSAGGSMHVEVASVVRETN